jgi:hypothetical protein
MKSKTRCLEHLILCLMLLALSLPGIVTAADGLKKVTLEWFKYYWVRLQF